MSGIKRGGKSRGAVRGHRFGVGSDTLLGYRDARFRIYLPAYKWVLEHRLASQVEQLRRLMICVPLRIWCSPIVVIAIRSMHRP